MMQSKSPIPPLALSVAGIDQSDNDESPLIPISIHERKETYQREEEDDDDDDDDDKRTAGYMKEARPVAIMLRNCFPPSQAITDTTHPPLVISNKKDEKIGKEESNGIIGTESEIKELETNSYESLKQIKNNSYVEEDEDENDTNLNDYHIFTKASQWRDKAKRNIFLPIEMEIVVSYSFLEQLHAHQKNEKVKSKFGDLFGLDNANASSSQQLDKEGDKHFIKRKTKDNSVVEDRLIVLCSKLQDTRSSHPQWDHIDEKLDELYDQIPKENDLWNDLYKAMRIQFRAIVPLQLNGTTNTDSHAGNYDANEDRCSLTEGCKTSKSILLATSPLHPFKLKSISSLIEHSTNTVSQSKLLGSSTFKESVPHSLPPNSILIHYSDGSTRICPGLFNLLVDKGVIIRKDNESKLDEELEIDKFAKRFDDDAFNVLEDYGYVNAKLKISSSTYESKTFKTDSDTNINETTSNVVKMSTRSRSQENSTQSIKEQFGVTNGFASERSSLSQSRQSSSRGAFADAFESMGQSISSIKSIRNEVSDISGRDVSADRSDYPICASSFGNIESDVPNAKQESSNSVQTVDAFLEVESFWRKQISDLENEIDCLESVYVREDLNLETLIHTQEVRSQALTSIDNALLEIDNEVEEMDQEYFKANFSCDLSHSLLQTRRKRILQQLFHIYPIQLLPDSVYTIRGIHLPNDMHSLTTSASDEIISAGLGFVCHVVSLCSKYLSIPLRYRLIFNSSRSAVRDEDNVDIYPLFKERMIEKPSFDQAVVLLHRNIELMLQMSGITLNTSSKDKHILAKLFLLFRDSVVKGDYGVT